MERCIPSPHWECSMDAAFLDVFSGSDIIATTVGNIGPPPAGGGEGVG